ncbi:hypothetical protein U1Q18_019473 [Sarracenia purpurea var. burkii]
MKTGQNQKAIDQVTPTGATPESNTHRRRGGTIRKVKPQDAYRDVVFKEIEKPIRELQPHQLSPKFGNQQKSLSQGRDGDQIIKRRVRTCKKKARSSIGAQMQIKGLTGTKRNVDFVTDAEDSRELARESTKKVRYENPMALDHPERGVFRGGRPDHYRKEWSNFT